jgi:exopolyphosphatase / guanosine-5'-triphosphate,3'-diphosphate pyrophosphatase
MNGERIAVIDLGSNTFHLLICEISADNAWVEIHKEREYVKLASGGIDLIDQETEQRAIDAMTRFVNLIKLHGVARTRAIGTAALREATNGLALADKLSSITGIPIEIIHGQQEAKYILLGIQSALPALKEYGLIMDIGGGSVEFILFKGDDVAFSGSFKIGVAVLFRMFHQKDPISADEIAALEKYLALSLKPLIDQIRKLGRYFLIGASGSFEVIYDVLPKKETGPHWAELEMNGIFGYMDEVINATLSERKTMREIPEERLDYIVVAYLLIRFLMKKVPPEKLYYCEFALKEGVVAEMIRK